MRFRPSVALTLASTAFFIFFSFCPVWPPGAAGLRFWAKTLYCFAPLSFMYKLYHAAAAVVKRFLKKS